MPKTAHGAPAPIPRTIAHAFLRCNQAGDNLLSVNPGLPAADALSIASCLLASAMTLVGSLVSTLPAHDGDVLGGAEYLIDFTKALIDSVDLEGDERENAAVSVKEAGDALAAALEDLLQQVESGTAPEIVTGGAIRALATWKTAAGGVQ
jgi:DUF3077 family protein